MKTFLFVTFLMFVGTTHAVDRTPQELYDPDVQRLIKAEFFAFGGVGIASRTSEGEEAFAAIVQKKEAIRFILAAFEYGNSHARCYALVALRESSPQLFRESIARIRKNPPKKIVMMSGCEVSEVKPAAVFDAIEAGTYAAYFKHHEEKG